MTVQEFFNWCLVNNVPLDTPIVTNPYTRDDLGYGDLWHVGPTVSEGKETGDYLQDRYVLAIG